ncbi:hypothetical protein L6F17_003202 [Providencia rettgeri]|uniref:hypothetical protein n=2 Tax=Morganellaceae TaxID=1903414 RepID=UPI001EFDE943|nr:MULTISPECIES: hypothetical protein [Providencia]EIU7558060.1 hypothetical protein [Providencia rettgeri]MCG5276310.1 hypothetical protein [Providencia rettgeri]
MAEIIINFNELILGEKKLFAGRANGRKACEKFNVQSFKPYTNDILSFKLPMNIVVSSSYFLGMLENVISKYDSPSELFKQIIINGKPYAEGDYVELDRAIKRGLHKNESFF